MMAQVAEKILAEPTGKATDKELPEPISDAAGQNRIQEIKAKIAETIRIIAKEHSALTPLDAIIALAPDIPRTNISNILTGMTSEDGYGDIKTVTTASELVFFYSETYIKVAEAAAKSLQEEIKFRIGEKVRAESREKVILTPVNTVLAELGVDKNTFNPHEVQKDERYADIKTVTASTGDVYFYSDKHMSGYYAVVLSRVAAKDPCATIAATVRDESKTYPRPTCILFFLEKVFNIGPCELEPIIAETLQKPEFSDIKKMVHPATGGVYLYSSQYLKEEAAWSIMDWQEVGKDANP